MTRMALALVLALVTAGFAACGAEDVSPETIAEAAKTTSDAGAARLEMDLGMTLPDGQELDMTGTGVMDPAGQRGRMTVDMSQIPGGAGELEQVFDGYVMWMRMPAFEAELPEGKEWIRIDLQRAQEELGIDMSQFPQVGNDPTKTLEYMRTAGEVEEIGEEDVRGTPTTHYSATVDFEKYPELVPEDKRAAAEESIEKLIDLVGESKFPVEVWIDDDDLVRRMKMEMPMNIPGAGEIEMTIDYELYDFGVEADLEPPPAEDVVDYTEIAAEAAGASVP
ncbi:MAG TPA: hypothetical protein VD790_07475 [Thermoleophilaceae bacterium]|nr:hypothetical protein [Thermoleophilaceae bacterium]